MMKKLLASCFVLCPQMALACTICQDVGQYGTSVTNSVANAGSNIASTTQSLATGYASTANALMTSGDSIVAAIMASSNSVTFEIEKSSQSQARLLDGLRSSIEEMERTKIVAENNLHVAETYGEQNIPRELCEDFSRNTARAAASTLSTSLIESNIEKQINDRKKEDRTQLVDPYTAGVVQLSSPEFTEEEAKIAMDQASVMSGEKSFSISPDVLLTMTTANGGASDSAASVMGAWMRTSNASQEISNQIANKTTPKAVSGAGEPISVYGDLWRSVELASNQDANIQDASASQATLLRSLARRISVSNRIKLEQLETQMGIARISASQIGYMNERAMDSIRESIDAVKNNAMIKR
jgi:hypothetical protein